MSRIRGRTLRIAHRGDWRDAPENTLAALQAALRVAACDGLEFDVRTSADDVPVLQHDETLARVHGRPERPSDLTSDELRAAGVSTLEEVLRSIPTGAFLDIEVKEGPSSTFADVVEETRGRELANAVVSSFVPAVLRKVKEQRADWPLWLNAYELSARTIALARDLGCVGISAEWHSIDAPSIRSANDARLEVAAWTVRRLPTFNRLSRLGVSAVCVEAAALDG